MRKRSMANISKNILINISKTQAIVENVFIGANYYPEEICTYTSLFK